MKRGLQKFPEFEEEQDRNGRSKNTTSESSYGQSNEDVVMRKLLDLTTTYQRQPAGGIPFMCTQCGKTYASRNSLQRHVDMKHSTGPIQEYKCELCSSTFPRSDTLRYHQMTIHNVAGKHVCPKGCPFSSNSIFGLQKHLSKCFWVEKHDME